MPNSNASGRLLESMSNYGNWKPWSILHMLASVSVYLYKNVFNIIWLTILDALCELR